MGVWNPQVWGSWLEWAVPELSYAVDSRIELFPERLWDDVELVAAGSDRTSAILDTYKVRVVVLLAEERTTVGPVVEGAGFRLT